ncbi:MAG: hypothetical protein QXD16_04815 [Sulfolobales archaeon]
MKKKWLALLTVAVSGTLLYLYLKKKKAEAEAIPSPPKTPAPAPPPEEAPLPAKEKEMYCVYYSPSSGMYYCSYTASYERVKEAVACYPTFEKCKEEAERRSKEAKPKVTPVPQEPYLSTEYYKIMKDYPHTVYSYTDESFTKESGLPTPYITNLGDGAKALEHLKNGKKRFIIEVGTHYEGGQEYTLVRDWRVLREDNQFWYCKVLFYKVKQRMV